MSFSEPHTASAVKIIFNNGTDLHKAIQIDIELPSERLTSFNGARLSITRQAPGVKSSTAAIKLIWSASRKK